MPVRAAPGGVDEAADEVQRVAAVDRAGRQHRRVAVADPAQHLDRRALRDARAPGEPGQDQQQHQQRACRHRTAPPASGQRDASASRGRRPGPRAGRGPGWAPSRRRRRRSTRAERARRRRLGGAVVRDQRQRARGQRVAGSRGSVSRNAAPSPGLAPGLQPAAVQPGVLEAIASPSPVPPVVRARAGSARQNRLNTSAASPGRRPTPWSRTATATASSSPRHARSRPGLPSPCSMALTTRLRRIRSTRRASTSAMTAVGQRADDQRSCRPRSARPPHVVDHARRPRRAGRPRSTSSTAAPASNRLISSRSASSASNRSSSLQQLGAAPQRRVELSSRGSCSTSAAIRTVVSGVRSSWETSETNRRCSRELLELADLALRLLGHLVERRGQPGEVVLAAHRHALVELARGEPLGDPRGQPHRVHDLPGDQPGDAGQQQRAAPAPPTISVLLTRSSVRCSLRRAGTGGRARGRRPAVRTRLADDQRRDRRRPRAQRSVT